jgi:hypothetical protein
METAYALKAFEDGHLRLDKSGKAERIIYVSANRSERWPTLKRKCGLSFMPSLSIATATIRDASLWRLGFIIRSAVVACLSDEHEAFAGSARP